MSVLVGRVAIAAQIADACSVPSVEWDPFLYTSSGM